MNKIEVWLIRHGKTICNEKKLYCGKSDISLSQKGRLELEILKQNIHYPICDEYYTSGAKRANETFLILYPNQKFKVINEFSEYNFGSFEMKSYDMLKKDNDYIKWITDDIGDVCCPNGESKKIYRQRIKEQFLKWINQCIIEGKKRVLLVSHGGTIGTILELYYDNSKDFYSYQPECGLGYKFNVSINKTELAISNLEQI